MWNVHRKSLTFFGISTAILSKLLGFRPAWWLTIPPCAPSPWQTPLRFSARCFYDWKKSQWNPPILQGEYIYINIIYIYYIYIYIIYIYVSIYLYIYMSINIYIYIYSPYIGVMVMGIDSAIFHQDGGVIRIRLDFFSPQLRWRRAASSQKRARWMENRSYPLVNIEKTMENHHY